MTGFFDKRNIRAATLVFILVPFNAFALECPSVGDPHETRVKVYANTAAEVLRKQPPRNLAAATETYIKNTITQVPNADKMLIQRIMIGVYCSSLKDDQSLTEKEKGERWLNYSCGVLRGLGRSDPMGCGPRTSSKASNPLNELLLPRGLHFGMSRDAVRRRVESPIEATSNDYGPYIAKDTMISSGMYDGYGGEWVYYFNETNKLKGFRFETMDKVFTNLTDPSVLKGERTKEWALQEDEKTRQKVAGVCSGHARMLLRLKMMFGEPVYQGGEWKQGERGFCDLKPNPHLCPPGQKDQKGGYCDNDKFSPVFCDKDSTEARERLLFAPSTGGYVIFLRTVEKEVDSKNETREKRFSISDSPRHFWCGMILVVGVDRAEGAEIFEALSQKELGYPGENFPF